MDPLIKHTIASLYKAEARRLTYQLAKKYSLDRYGEAEDIIHHAFEKALNSWTVDTLPSSPIGWIYETAKNKALDHIKARKGYSFQDLESYQQQDSGHLDGQTATYGQPTDIDATLVMSFACCHPSLPFESQIALALRTLFSLSVEEVARALSITYANAEKRLTRARKSAAELGIRLELPTNYPDRLPAVLAILYLCFNEGYYSRTKDPIRFELCTDTIALLHNLLQDEQCQTPSAYALMSLCCFHAARLKARQDLYSPHETIILTNQNRDHYDKKLIDFANYYLNLSAKGTVITQYHLEAAIASAHCAAPSYEQTDWVLISDYYQRLVRINKSPNIMIASLVARMNANGAGSILDDFTTAAVLLGHNYYYHMLGMKIGQVLKNHEVFASHQSRALELAVTDSERQFTAEQSYQQD